MLKLTRWTIAHRRLVVVSWIVIAASVLAVSQAVGRRDANNFSLPNTDSQRAVDLLQSQLSGAGRRRRPGRLPRRARRLVDDAARAE